MRRLLIGGTVAGLFVIGLAVNAGAKERLHHITGVVTRVDNGKLTLVVPVGTETDITRAGRSVDVEEGVNLVALSGQPGADTEIYRNGKQATLSDLKEGDIVRTVLDPATSKFEQLSAVSQKIFDDDINRARNDLKHEPLAK